MITRNEFESIRRGDDILWRTEGGDVIPRRVVANPGIHSTRSPGLSIKVESLKRWGFAAKPYTIYAFNDVEQRVIGVRRGSR